MYRGRERRKGEEVMKLGKRRKDQKSEEKGKECGENQREGEGNRYDR